MSGVHARTCFFIWYPKNSVNREQEGWSKAKQNKSMLQCLEQLFDSLLVQSYTRKICTCWLIGWCSNFVNSHRVSYVEEGIHFLHFFFLSKRHDFKFFNWKCNLFAPYFGNENVSFWTFLSHLYHYRCLEITWSLEKFEYFLAATLLRVQKIEI